MLDFRPGAKRALPAHARIDGIDGNFLFGNGAAPGLAPGSSPLPLAFGGHTGKLGLSPCVH